MLYGEALYNEVLLGANQDNVVIGWGPTDLNAYQNTVDNIIFYWTMTPYNPALDDLGAVWILETSLASDFSNPTVYQSDTIGAENFISGVIYRGMVTPSPARLQGESRTIYWRVRVRLGDNQVSGWTTGSYDIPEAVDDVIRNAQQAFLPDTIYSKNPDSNIYQIHDAYATELDALNNEIQFFSADSTIAQARDRALVPNFGDLLGITRPQRNGVIPELPNVDYRSILRAFMTNIRYAPSQESVSNMVFSIYRVYPSYFRIADEQDAYSVPQAAQETTPYYSWLVPPPDELNAYTLSKQNMDFGIIIEIGTLMTPAGRLIITDAWAQAVIKRMIPAHVPVYFRYV